MYGMIHRGLRQMVIEQSGTGAWSEIEAKLGTGTEHLISGQMYDDSVTLAMVGTAAERLGQSVPDCLTEYGRYWIRFAERGSYGAMMDFTGKDFVTFVDNLDRMHMAVNAAMPEAIVPSFRISGRDEGYVRVEYRSERNGLEPFVTGLFEGLLDRFDLEGTVELVSTDDNVAEFLVRFSPA